MNIYVAGITIAEQDQAKSLKEKTRLTATLLKQIHKDAQVLGKDTIVVAVMQEYALTPVAVSTVARRKSLGTLRKAIAHYDNMILVPGTYASQEKYVDPARKRRKIKKVRANYNELLTSELVVPSVLDSNIDLLQKTIKKRTLGKSTFLQNCAYLLTSTSKFKHKKSAPWNELDLMQDGTKQSGIYYIGADDYVKQVNIQHHELDVALFICREHNSMQYEKLKLAEHPPLLHIVVSDFVGIIKDNLFGALNIHMDSKAGLCIKKNDGHCRQASIGEVRAYTYSTDQLSHFVQPVKIKSFNRTVGPQPASPALFSWLWRTDSLPAWPKEPETFTHVKRSRSENSDDDPGRHTRLKR